MLKFLNVIVGVLMYLCQLLVTGLCYWFAVIHVILSHEQKKNKSDNVDAQNFK